MRVRPMLLRRPSFLFDCFVKIWKKGQKFFGQMVYRPPWQKIARTPMSPTQPYYKGSYGILLPTQLD